MQDAAAPLETKAFALMTAAGAAVAAGWPLPPQAAEGVDAQRMRALLVDRHRLGAPVLALVADALASRSPAVAAALAADARRQRMRALDQARRTIMLSRLLDRHGIAHLVVKGVVLSQQLYGDVGARASKDIDLLVDPARLADAGAAILAAGYRRTDGAADADAVRKHRTYAAGAIQIELHDRLLDLSSYLALPFEAVWARRGTIAVLDQPLPVLNDVDTLLYLCAHGSEHVWFRLKWLHDIARILAIDTGGRTLAAAQAARAAGFDRVFDATMALVAELFAIVLPDPLPLAQGSADVRARRRAVALAQAALVAPAALAHAPTMAWVARRSFVQLGARRDWRYRRDLIADLTTGPRSFDPAGAGGWRLLRLPVRALRFWRSRRSPAA